MYVCFYANPNPPLRKTTLNCFIFSHELTIKQYTATIVTNLVIFISYLEGVVYNWKFLAANFLMYDMGT